MATIKNILTKVTHRRGAPKDAKDRIKARDHVDEKHPKEVGKIAHKQALKQQELEVNGSADIVTPLNTPGAQSDFGSATEDYMTNDEMEDENKLEMEIAAQKRREAYEKVRHF